MTSPTASPDPDLLAAVFDLLTKRRADHDGLFVLGICGSQGSGKSTLARALQARLEVQGIASAVLSLDDLYLGKAARAALAADVHPLFATRGVPGTHDVMLGLEVVEALRRSDAVRLPRFSKAEDDRAELKDWPLAPKVCRVLIFEGWCLGAVPQDQAALERPVNSLEAEEDRSGHWRRHANACLAGDYQRLFDEVDALIFLAAPSFGVVEGWRLQQESELQAGSAVMDARRVHRFVQHYQRLTEWILREMPTRADLTARLDEQRRVTGITSSRT